MTARSAAESVEQVLFRGRAFSAQHLALGERQPARAGELLLDQCREREIEVVAAEEQVLADRNPLEDELAIVDQRPNQAEVGRASADVADEDQGAVRESVGQSAPMRGDPRVERGQRFFEQRDVRESRRCAALTVSSRASSSNEAGTVSTIGCRSKPPFSSVRAKSWFHASRRCASTRADASTGDSRGRSIVAPRQQRGRAIDARIREPRFRRRDLPRRHQRAVDRARSTPTTHLGAASQGSRDSAGVAFGLVGEIEERRQRRAARRLHPGRPAEERRTRRPGRAAAAHASAELVVPRSMPMTACGDGVRVRAHAPGCSAPASSDAMPSRATHQSSSVPISVTRLSSVTGTVTSLRPVIRQRDLERAQLLEIVAPVLDHRARRIASCGSSS